MLSTVTQFASEAAAMRRHWIGFLMAWAALPGPPARAGEPPLAEGFVNAPSAEAWRLFASAQDAGLRRYAEQRSRSMLERIAKRYWPRCARCKAEEAH